MANSDKFHQQASIMPNKTASIKPQVEEAHEIIRWARRKRRKIHRAAAASDCYEVQKRKRRVRLSYYHPDSSVSSTNDSKQEEKRTERTNNNHRLDGAGCLKVRLLSGSSSCQSSECNQINYCYQGESPPISLLNNKPIGRRPATRSCSRPPAAIKPSASILSMSLALIALLTASLIVCQQVVPIDSSARAAVTSTSPAGGFHRLEGDFDRHTTTTSAQDATTTTKRAKLLVPYERLRPTRSPLTSGQRADGPPGGANHTDGEHALLVQLLQSTGSLDEASFLIESLIRSGAEQQVTVPVADYNQVRATLSSSQRSAGEDQLLARSDAEADPVPFRVFMPPPLADSEMTLTGLKHKGLLDEIIEAGASGAANAAANNPSVNYNVHYDDEQSTLTGGSSPPKQLSLPFDAQRAANLLRASKQIEHLLSPPAPELIPMEKTATRNASDEDGLSNNESISSLMIRAGNSPRRLIANYSHWINHEQIVPLPLQQSAATHSILAHRARTGATRSLEASEAPMSTTSANGANASASRSSFVDASEPGMISALSDVNIVTATATSPYTSTTLRPFDDALTSDMRDFLKVDDLATAISIPSDEQATTEGPARQAKTPHQVDAEAEEFHSARNSFARVQPPDAKLGSGSAINNLQDEWKKLRLLRKNETGVHKIVFVNSMPHWSSSRTNSPKTPDRDGGVHVKRTGVVHKRPNQPAAIVKRSTTTTTTTEAYLELNVFADTFKPTTTESPSTTVINTEQPTTGGRGEQSQYSIETYDLKSTKPPRNSTTSAPTSTTTTSTKRPSTSKRRALAEITKKPRARKSKPRTPGKNKKNSRKVSPESTVAQAVSTQSSVSSTSTERTSPTSAATTTTTTAAAPVSETSTTTMEPPSTTLSPLDLVEETTRRSGKSLRLAHLFLGTNSASQQMPMSTSKAFRKQTTPSSKRQSDNPALDTSATQTTPVFVGLTETAAPVTMGDFVAPTPDSLIPGVEYATSESAIAGQQSASSSGRWHAVELPLHTVLPKASKVQPSSGAANKFKMFTFESNRTQNQAPVAVGAKVQVISPSTDSTMTTPENTERKPSGDDVEGSNLLLDLNRLVVSAVSGNFSADKLSNSASSIRRSTVSTSTNSPIMELTETTDYSQTQLVLPTTLAVPLVEPTQPSRLDLQKPTSAFNPSPSVGGFAKSTNWSPSPPLKQQENFSLIANQTTPSSKSSLMNKADQQALSQKKAELSESGWKSVVKQAPAPNERRHSSGSLANEHQAMMGATPNGGVAGKQSNSTYMSRLVNAGAQAKPPSMIDKPLIVGSHQAHQVAAGSAHYNENYNGSRQSTPLQVQTGSHKGSLFGKRLQDQPSSRLLLDIGSDPVEPPALRANQLTATPTIKQEQKPQLGGRLSSGMTVNEESFSALAHLQGSANESGFDLIRSHHLGLIEKKPVHVLKLELTRAGQQPSSTPTPTTTPFRAMDATDASGGASNATRIISLESLSTATSEPNAISTTVSPTSEDPLEASSREPIRMVYQEPAESPLRSPKRPPSSAGQATGGAASTSAPNAPTTGVQLLATERDPLPSILFHNRLSSLFQYKLANRTASSADKPADGQSSTNAKSTQLSSYPFAEYRTKESSQASNGSVKAADVAKETATAEQQQVDGVEKSAPLFKLLQLSSGRPIKKVDGGHNKDQLNLGFYGAAAKLAAFSQADKNRSPSAAVTNSMPSEDTKLESNNANGLSRSDWHKPAARRRPLASTDTSGGNSTDFEPHASTPVAYSDRQRLSSSQSDWRVSSSFGSLEEDANSLRQQQSLHPEVGQMQQLSPTNQYNDNGPSEAARKQQQYQHQQQPGLHLFGPRKSFSVGDQYHRHQLPARANNSIVNDNKLVAEDELPVEQPVSPATATLAKMSRLSALSPYSNEPLLGAPLAATPNSSSASTTSASVPIDTGSLNNQLLAPTEPSHFQLAPEQHGEEQQHPMNNGTVLSMEDAIPILGGQPVIVEGESAIVNGQWMAGLDSNGNKWSSQMGSARQRFAKPEISGGQRKRRREPPVLASPNQEAAWPADGKADSKPAFSGLSLQEVEPPTRGLFVVKERPRERGPISLGNLFTRLPQVQPPSEPTATNSPSFFTDATSNQTYLEVAYPQLSPPEESLIQRQLQHLEQQQKRRRELNKEQSEHPETGDGLQFERQPSYQSDSDAFATMQANATSQQVRGQPQMGPLVDEYRTKSLLKTMINLGVPSGSGAVPASGLRKTNELVRLVKIDKSHRRDSTRLMSNVSTDTSSFGSTEFPLSTTTSSEGLQTTGLVPPHSKPVSLPPRNQVSNGNSSTTTVSGPSRWRSSGEVKLKPVLFDKLRQSRPSTEPSRQPTNTQPVPSIPISLNNLPQGMADPLPSSSNQVNAPERDYTTTNLDLISPSLLPSTPPPVVRVAQERVKPAYSPPAPAIYYTSETNTILADTTPDLQDFNSNVLHQGLGSQIEPIRVNLSTINQGQSSTVKSAPVDPLSTSDNLDGASSNYDRHQNALYDNQRHKTSTPANDMLATTKAQPTQTMNPLEDGSAELSPEMSSTIEFQPATTPQTVTTIDLPRRDPSNDYHLNAISRPINDDVASSTSFGGPTGTNTTGSVHRPPIWLNYNVQPSVEQSSSQQREVFGRPISQLRNQRHSFVMNTENQTRANFAPEPSHLSSIQRVAMITVGVCCTLIVASLLLVAVTIKCRRACSSSGSPIKPISVAKHRRRRDAKKRSSLQQVASGNIVKSRTKNKRTATKRLAAKMSSKGRSTKNNQLLLASSEFSTTATDNSVQLCSSAESTTSVCQSTTSDAIKFINATSGNHRGARKESHQRTREKRSMKPALPPKTDARQRTERQAPSTLFSSRMNEKDLNLGNVVQHPSMAGADLFGAGSTLRQRISGTITSRLLRLHLPRLLPYFALDYAREQQQQQQQQFQQPVQNHTVPNLDRSAMTKENQQHQRPTLAMGDLLLKPLMTNPIGQGRTMPTLMHNDNIPPPLPEKSHHQLRSIPAQSGVCDPPQNFHLRQTNDGNKLSRLFNSQAKQSQAPQQHQHFEQRKQPKRAPSKPPPCCNNASCSSSWLFKGAASSLTAMQSHQQQPVNHPQCPSLVHYNLASRSKLPFGTASSVLRHTGNHLESHQSSFAPINIQPRAPNLDHAQAPIDSGHILPCNFNRANQMHHRLNAQGRSVPVLDFNQASDNVSAQHSQVDNEHHLLIDTHNNPPVHHDSTSQQIGSYQAQAQRQQLSERFIDRPRQQPVDIVYDENEEDTSKNVANNSRTNRHAKRSQQGSNGITGTYYGQRRDLADGFSTDNPRFNEYSQDSGNHANIDGRNQVDDGDDVADDDDDDGAAGESGESDNYFNLEHNYDGHPTFRVDEDRSDRQPKQKQQSTESRSIGLMEATNIMRANCQQARHQANTHTDKLQNPSSNCNCNLVLYPL